MLVPRADTGTKRDQGLTYVVAAKKAVMGLWEPRSPHHVRAAGWS